jgi:glutamyl-tRNA synthetase
MGITHVVRGEDHVTNTGLQIQMFEALGAVVPAFAHEALLVGSEGKLSKRLGSLGVDAMREAGIEPIALIAKLARIGTSLPVEPVTAVEPLVESFDFATFGRAPARFDMEELAGLNARILHQLPFESVANRLPSGVTAEAWEAIRPNIGRVEEAADWWHVIEGPVDQRASGEDREFLLEAAETAEGMEWSGNPWAALTSALKQSSGRTGKALFHPLRRALTGRDSGPEMALLLPLIGKDRSVERLREGAQG